MTSDQGAEALVINGVAKACEGIRGARVSVRSSAAAVVTGALHTKFSQT